MNKFVGTGSIIFLSCLLLFFQNCGTEFGDPTIDSTVGEPREINMKIAAYEDAKATPSSPVTSVTALKLCFEDFELEFSTGSVFGSDEIELNLTEVNVDPSGTDLGTINAPSGTFNEIEIRLRGDECSDEKSVVVTNANGTFQTEDRIRLELNGTFTVSETSNDLKLIFDNIVLALDGVTANNQIAPAIQGAFGQFEEDDD